MDEERKVGCFALGQDHRLVCSGFMALLHELSLSGAKDRCSLGSRLLESDAAHTTNCLNFRFSSIVADSSILRRFPAMQLVDLSTEPMLETTVWMFTMLMNSPVQEPVLASTYSHLINIISTSAR